jgi:predicted unusual protein kinase regulating ubiquinone biosynthesis (AarF/ABC1/UbiB family)
MMSMCVGWYLHCVFPPCLPRVLVLERLVGVPLTDLDSITSITSKEPEGVLIAALNTWFASVLGAETFHADVHAGRALKKAAGTLIIDARRTLRGAGAAAPAIGC